MYLFRYKAYSVTQDELLYISKGEHEHGVLIEYNKFLARGGDVSSPVMRLDGHTNGQIT